MVDKNNNARGMKDKSMSMSRSMTRGRKSTGDTSMVSAAKRRKVERLVQPIQERGSGQVFTFGAGECGQLGLGPNVNTKRKFPCLVEELEDTKVIQVAAGGMHTVVLTEEGKVFTFGVNDDLALGRVTNEEEEQFEPKEVDLAANKIVQISAGDSHSVALTDDGKVFVWGTFKDMNGNFGLVPGNPQKCLSTPQLISDVIGAKVFKISSGDNHLVMLTEEGKVFTCGTGEQGQLGRPVDKDDVGTGTITRSRSRTPKLTPREILLIPREIKNIRKKFRDIWTGNYSTYCRTERNNEIWVFGLNNYHQLGFECADTEKPVVGEPTKSPGLLGHQWIQIAAGQHHAIALDEDGKVYVFGRSTDGRLGLGEDEELPDGIAAPTLVTDLSKQKCVQVAAGLSTTYALTSGGKLYSWGFGGNHQLGTGNEDNGYEPSVLENMSVKKVKMQIEDSILYVTAGGQHAAVIINRGQ